MKTKRNWRPLYQFDNRRPAKEFTREQAFTRPPIGRTFYVGTDGESITMYYRSYTLSAIGCKENERIFWKQTTVCNCTYKNGKFYGNITPFTEAIKKAFNLEWLNCTENKWLENILLTRKDLWKLLITHKVNTSEELVNAFSKKYFKGVYSYKAIKDFYNDQRMLSHGISLWDLYEYTTNANKVLKRLYNKDIDLTLFKDTLYYAKLFGEKIHHSWSNECLRKKHQAQIELNNIKEINAKCDINIAEPFSCDGLSLILNEKECYLEGIDMHNCVYSCYWGQIRAGRYLIAKGNVKNTYVNLGMRYDKNIIFDQVYSYCNKSVNPEVKEFCLKWIETNKEKLEDITSKINKEFNKEFMKALMYDSVEIPF